MDEMPIRSKDIVLQSIYPKRLCIATGQHTEFLVDAKIVLRMLDLMKKAEHEGDDVDDKNLRVEYNEDSENEHDLWCMIRFDDFSICRLKTKEFKKIKKGFAEFFKWAADYRLPFSEPFLFKVK